jgi:acetyltransferase-like isoleucine patch superfamily enzyme
MVMYRFQRDTAESVRIGVNVLITSNVLITDLDHVVEPNGMPVTRNGKQVTASVVVEDNCWIGQNRVILKGVAIGHDSIVGANGVVTQDIPPLSISAGNPARIIRGVEPRSHVGKGTRTA